MGFIESLFDHSTWRPAFPYKFEHYENPDKVPYGVVVIPARHHADMVTEINAVLGKLRWCIVILIGDEEAAFPVDSLNHEYMKVWVMTPTFGKYQNIDRYLGDGWPPAIRSIGARLSDEKTTDWFYSGQVTHERRKQCVESLKDVPGGEFIETAGFTQGLPHEEYYAALSAAKVAPCPSGPETPDTFRLYEALELGCVPLADDLTPKSDKPTNYWTDMYGDVPFPVIHDWADAPGYIENLRDRYPTVNNRVFAWWQQEKRKIAYALRDDIRSLHGEFDDAIDDDDSFITVLIPTSPIAAHPDTSIIEETVGSVRDRLPNAEIIIMFDGVRAQQESYRASYEEYIRRVLWKCNWEWHNVLPLVFDEHMHQAGMTREALRLVQTEAVLFVEHDTPLCEDIPFDSLLCAVLSPDADLVRLHHEALVLPEHRQLMIGEREPFCGEMMWRTYQWSQRPHIAKTEFYRRIIADHFPTTSRTMIEDKMHGIVHQAYVIKGRAGWNEYKLWMYAPDGDMKRSYHTDGRKADPKFDMVFE